MSGPWEKYAAATAAEGPWSKYAKPAEPEPKQRKRSVDELRRNAAEYSERNPVTKDMGTAARIAAGAGKSISDTMQGLGQLVGRVSPQDVADKRSVDDALMNTPAGIGGNFIGSVAQVVTPGVLLKGASKVGALSQAAPALATSARAFLPSTIRGAAAQGAVYGGIQPITADESRGLNVVGGAGLGAIGAAVPKGLAGLARSVRGTPSTARGVDRRLAEVLRAEAENPAALMAPQPSAIPGVQRTLAEETMDPGIARLERYARGMGNGFDPIDRANNAARVGALGKFAGDSGAIKQAKAMRDAAATPLRNRAMKDAGVDMGPIHQAIESGIQKNATRSSVRRAIEDVQAEMANADGSVQSLYGVRKSIDDLLTGKAGSDKSYAKAASRELMDIKGVLDQQIAAKSPAFGQYLAAFSGGSKAVDRMRVGQRLVRSGGAQADPKTGQRILTPAAFSRAADDLDSLAARATGFKKAKAEDYLQPEDLATINAVQDDLGRVGFAATAGSNKGSPTQPLMALNDRVVSGVAARVPGAKWALQYLEEVGQRRLQTRLVEVLANPAQARSILARVPAHDRRIIETALSRAGGTVGASVPAFRE